jgi:hypothetical protein
MRKNIHDEQSQRSMKSCTGGGACAPLKSVFQINFREPVKGSTKIIEVRTLPESQETATITVTESGYLDDAVGGERWRLWLAKGTNGTNSFGTLGSLILKTPAVPYSSPRER